MVRAGRLAMDEAGRVGEGVIIKGFVLCSMEFFFCFVFLFFVFYQVDDCESLVGCVEENHKN